MADRQSLIPVFAPGLRLSLGLLALAFVLTVGLFHGINWSVESSARAALQVPDAKAILRDHGSDAQTAVLDTRSPYALNAAWGVFDPLAKTDKEQCAGDGPLVSLLKGLACIEPVFQPEELQLPNNLQMANECNFTDFAFGTPPDSEGQRSANEAQIEIAMDKLVDTVLGVEALSLPWSLIGLRNYVRDRSLGVVVSISKQNEVREAWAHREGADLGLLYWIYVDPDAPDTVLSNPACRALRDGFDGFAENVLSAHRRAQDAVAIQSWTLRSLNGPLQFVMIVLFVWGLLRLAARRFIGRRMAGATDRWREQIKAYGSAGTAEAAITTALEISEKALERWLAEVIPMLGFLGTVIGMILAMERVGDVVAASPGVELDTAMDGITGALSVAFFTTFIGLIASLILILLQNLQAAWEQDRIRLALQENASEISDAASQSSPASGPPPSTENSR